MSEQETKLLPQVPVMCEYDLIKTNLEAKIKTLNSITTLTEENKKEVKTSIAEINKVKERISRYRIDETNRFMEYIQPYINKCKELEKLCDTGLADIKAKVKELETQEKNLKIDTLRKTYDFYLEHKKYVNILKFELFFEEKMANKTTSINVIQKQLEDWYEKREQDLDFIHNNVDDSDKVISIYLKNGLNLTKAIEAHQDTIKSEAEIAAAMNVATTTATATSNTFEKKLDIVITIKQLPKSKVTALQSFLDNLGVEFDVNIAK